MARGKAPQSEIAIVTLFRSRARVLCPGVSIVGVPNAAKRSQWAANQAKRAAAVEGSLRPITRPDCDNYAKVVDGLNGIAWHDDAQIVTLLVTKHYSEQPRLEFVASELAA